MRNLILFGPPGRKRHPKRSRDHYTLVHLSTGDIFRANIKGGRAGQLAKSYMNQGQLKATMGPSMLESVVNKHPDAAGFILTAFPHHCAGRAGRFLEGKANHLFHARPRGA